MVNGHPDGLRVVTEADWGPELPVILGIGSCREVVGSRLGCTLRSLYHFTLQQMSRTIDFHHDDEAVYYVIEGTIEVIAGDVPASTVAEGGMFHVRPHTTYSFSTVAGAVVLGGPSPVDEAFGAALPCSQIGGGITLHHRDAPGLMVPFISADARLVVWYGAGAVSANMNYVVLEPGERNKEHLHAYSEDTIFILSGRGTAEDHTHGTRLPFGPGDVVTIPPGVVHAVAADLGERVVSVGGPCPADLDMLRAVGVNVEALSAELAQA